MAKLYHRLIQRVKRIQKKGVGAGKKLLRRSLAAKSSQKLKTSFKKITKNKSKISKDTSRVASRITSEAKRAKNKEVKMRAGKSLSEISQEQFSLTPFQILREDGKVVGKIPSLSSQQLKELYGFMVLSRAFDDAALKLQRQGRLGTYGSVRGQEASQVGSAYCLKKEDWLVPSFRENASCITRGMPMKCLFQYWGGDERGHAQTESMTTLPLSIPIATQLIHGVGLAMAIAFRNEKKAVLAHVGDGGTSEGDFHEALNFAGVFKAPVVFLIQNNQWAISVPRKKQTASHTLAQKALAYGFIGIQVDGNDILAVYSVVSAALAKARTGGGPTLIECVTYRIGDHTTADDAKRYRNQTEVDAWAKKDPLERLKKYMLAKKIWNTKQETALLEEMSAKVSAAVKAYEDEPPADPKDVFAYTYATMTPQLVEQYQSLVGSVESKKDPNILEKVEGGFP